MKSHRPRRRKQAAQPARPGIVDGSACQPNMASVKAETSIGARVSEAVEGVGVLDVEDGGLRKEDA